MSSTQPSAPAGAARQHELAQRFRALHERPGAFVIPNPWDAGSARLMAAHGFEALATTSAGHAFSLGIPDGQARYEQVLDYLREIAGATELPVTADFESGWGDTPQAVARAFREAAATGIVGASIEDATGRADDPLFSVEEAAERVRAACEAARSMGFPFTVTARAETFSVGRVDLADAIRRLQAYQEAGADVLYAPGLRTLEEVATVVRSVDRPVNVVMGFSTLSCSVEELAAAGVKRISVGGSLARRAIAALRAALDEISAGGFTYTREATPHRELQKLFAGS